MAVVLTVDLLGTEDFRPLVAAGEEDGEESDDARRPNRPMPLAFVFSESSLSSCISFHQASKSALVRVVFPNPARPATIMFNETTRGFSFKDSGDPIE